MGEWKNSGNLDYVAGWYKKSAEIMTRNTFIKAALVSTNSITQGEQVFALWYPLTELYSVKIDFAYKTFIWDSEANVKAHVHCVIIGFSHKFNITNKRLFDDGNIKNANNINGYLIDAPNIFIQSRSKPLCDIPKLLTGSQRLDDDNFMFTKEEKDRFVKLEPNSEKFFYLWYGADEFINNRPRYCLYLGKCTPAELNNMPRVKEIVEKVRDYRLKSSRPQTVKCADKPTRFYLEVIPDKNYMIVPIVSSERRRYIPMGFMTPNVLCSNQVNLIPNTTEYHFGVLESNVHMAWMRAVAGRLKSDYRYSKDIVYNNFPWPNPTNMQKHKIEKTARTILETRMLYPDSSLADLYDEISMPAELRKAHQENDKAVMEAYGFDWHNMTESECVAELMKMYKKLSNE